ncbi:acetyl-CoA acetyltransferase [Escherichia phage vB_EcolP_P433.1]|uniref:Acetyl-CoA acetyltransferase n=1 Tax=Escherichia phage vB_EcolP_P433.1 TaxID=2653657 RepID=A0AAE6TVB7_9CAUD|nr:acetyl-CoA acetyltransferase [Escherichia phage vB_EcolP_P433.1]
MANEYSNQPLTGRYDRKQVQPVSEHLMVPSVNTDNALYNPAKQASVINDTTKSGKQIGAMIVTEEGVLMLSRGSGPTSEWDQTKTAESIVPV